MWDLWRLGQDELPELRRDRGSEERRAVRALRGVRQGDVLELRRERQGAVIAAAGAEAAMLGWRVLASHAASCDACRRSVQELRGCPDDPFPLWERLCEAGRALFGGWIDASNEVAEQFRSRTRPWGLAGLRGPAAEERAAALTALPAAAARDIFATVDDELREAKIAGVIAAYRAGSVMRPEPAPAPAAARPRGRPPGAPRARPRPMLGSGLDEEDQ